MNILPIRLDTQSDVIKLVDLATKLGDDVHITLEDGKGHIADAKSLMGCMYGKVEFKEPYLRSEYEGLSDVFRDFLR